MKIFDKMKKVVVSIASPSRVSAKKSGKQQRGSVSKGAKARRAARSGR
tara:strand:+ start:491 stop:634 length:144 start_codon:yes stop_codon:yes gene_type:complete